MKPTKIEAPTLEIDAIFADRYNMPVSGVGMIERRIVANLINHLDHNGIKLLAVNDGESVTKVSSIKDAMELIFNLDVVNIVFLAKDAESEKESHNVLVMLGEGVTCITDWSFTTGDPDGFDSAMCEFDEVDFF